MSDQEDDKPKKKQVKTNVLTEEQKKVCKLPEFSLFRPTP